MAGLGPDELITFAMQRCGHGSVSLFFVFDNEDSWFHKKRVLGGASPAGRSGANPQAYAARLAVRLRGCSGSRSLTLASHHNNLPRQRAVPLAFVETVDVFAGLQVGRIDGLGSPGSLLLQE